MGMAGPPEEPRFCRKCSYNLRGIESVRCPECGRPFEPADPKTYRRRPRTRWGVWVRRALILCLIGLVLYSLPILWLWWGWQREQAAGRKASDLGQVIADSIAPPALIRILPDRLEFLSERITDIAIWPSPQPLSDADLAPLKQCASLQRLTVLARRVTDSGFDALAGIPRLEEIYLSCEGVTDDGIVRLSRAPSLQRVEIRRTEVGDKALEALAAMPHIRHIGLTSDAWTEPTVQRLR